MKQKIFKLISLVLILSICINISLPCFASETKRIVKVGIFDLGDFQYIDDNGKACGYNIELLNRISKQTNWDYEYIACENWVEATSLLEDGEIDLLAPAQNIQSLSDKFLYTSYNIGIEFASVYCLADRNDIIYEDIEAMSKLTYGCAKNSTFAEKFLEYAQQKGFTPNIKYYDNTTEQFNALNNHEVGAIVTNIMFWNSNIKSIARFSPLPIYYITNKNNSDLISQLDLAINDIQLNNPTFQADLIEEYFPYYKNTEYTFEEQQYIQNADTIKIGVQFGRNPICYLDDDGNPKGITIDVLQKIEKISGLKFAFEDISKEKNVNDLLNDDICDIVSDSSIVDDEYYQKDFRMSNPIWHSSLVFVVKDKIFFNIYNDCTIAIPEQFTMLKDYLQDTYPNMTLKFYNNLDDCDEAILNNEVDGTIQNIHIANRELQKPIYSDLKVVTLYNIPQDFALQFNNYVDSNLISIINKSIAIITKEELDKIIRENSTANPYVLTTKDILYKYCNTIIIVSILVLVCILLFVIIIINRQRNIKQIKKQNGILKDAIVQAEIASKAKNEFLSRMSHEIRTPMNAIVGLTKIAKKHEDNPIKIDDYLSKINSASKVLLNLINDILDMSAIENNKLKIAHAPFDLKSLLNDISNMYYSQCKQKDIKFEMVTYNINHETLIGDALRTNQILLNLVSNAFKFTPSGGTISININETIKNENRLWVRFMVSDTGIGMSEEVKARLFKPFEQESATTAQKYGGSGLGLSIAKNLVDIMHGTISVQSTKDVGTTFIVDIPFEFYDNENCEQYFKISNCKALIIDDDKCSIEYTSAVLTKVGASYDIASSINKAKTLIDNATLIEEHYDICFIDWNLSNSNNTNINIIKTIREMFDVTTTVIVVSAYDISEIENTARQLGADLFISKPLFQSTIFNLLMEIYNGQYDKHIPEEIEVDFTGKRILLAEDNALNTEVALELLESTNAQVDCAENGKQVLEMFTSSNEGTYDVILMDIQMPIMDGYTATKNIRECNHPQAKSIPILAMTANAFSEDVSKAISCGMNGHISKPIDTDLLYKSLKEIF